jgi:uroporphyrinogen-III synthase
MKNILYLGTDPTNFHHNGNLIHYPVIRIVPRALNAEIMAAFADLPQYTHVIFTSKHAVDIFFSYRREIDGKQIVAVGKITAEKLEKYGCSANLIAKDETQEGIITELNKQNLKNAYIFLPRSSLSRPALTNYLTSRNIRYCACDFYDTLPARPATPFDLSLIDEIVFTSPSTVEAFFKIHPVLPKKIKLTPIGPVTKDALLKIISAHVYDAVH